MKSLHIATALAFAITLAACGGRVGADTPMQLASVTVSDSASTAPAPATASTGAAPVTAAPAANMPAPDCAAEGCASLRIIDGNAEAWRIDAQRRAAAHADL